MGGVKPSIATMRKRDLTALGATLGLGSRAALDVRPIEQLRRQVQQAWETRNARHADGAR